MKRIVVCLVLVFCISAGLVAFSWSPSTDIAGGLAFFLPTVEELKGNGTLRTSAFGAVDLNLVRFSAGRFDFGGGFCAAYVSKSNVYGHNIMKAYYQLGGGLGFSYQFSKVFTLGLFSRLMVATLRPVGVDQFAAIEAELQPSFTIVDNSRGNVGVFIPVTAAFRKDGVTFRSGLGVHLALDVQIGGTR